MDATRLKDRFGKKVTFWGGACSTQTTLPFGSPEDVEREVAERIRVLAPEGGFVFSAEQTIQDEVPVENTIALYEAASKYGNYPIRNE
jgi:uroporphyrinogen decarboxylase